MSHSAGGGRRASAAKKSVSVSSASERYRLLESHATNIYQQYVYAKEVLSYLTFVFLDFSEDSDDEEGVSSWKKKDEERKREMEKKLKEAEEK